MKRFANIVQMLIRVTSLILIVLGIILWSGHGAKFTNDHIRLGVLFVLCLWTVCFIAIGAGVNRGLAVFAVLWGLLTMMLGMMQMRWMPGESHWIIRVVHLLVGIAAIGLAEKLSADIKRAPVPKPA